MDQRTAHGSAKYLVELTAPRAGWKDVERLIRRARETIVVGDARFVRAIFLPEDSSFLLLYEAGSAREAATAAAGLEFVVDRVSEIVSTGGQRNAGE